MPSRLWIFASPLMLVATCAAAVVAVVVALPPRAQTAAVEMLQTRAGVVLLGVVVLLLLSYGAAWRFYRRHVLPLRRLADETRLLFTTNPAHRLALESDASISAVAAAVNAGAERLEQLHRRLDTVRQEAHAEVEHERHLLAGLIAELAEGVVVCTLEGEVLLYNATARDLLDTDPPADRRGPVGLGRSVFSAVDARVVRHALHVLERRVEAGDVRPDVHVLMSAGTHLLRTRVLPVLGEAGAMDSFVLVFTDVTAHAHADDQRDDLLATLMQEARAHVDAIRSAIENLIARPRLDADERQLTEQIVHDETVAIKRLLQHTETAMSKLARPTWTLDPMRGEHLLQMVQQRAGQVLDARVEIASDGDASTWVQVDSYGMVTALLFLMSRLANHIGTTRFVLRLDRQESFVTFDVAWTGPELSPQTLRAWSDEPMSVHDEVLPHTLHEVMQRQGVEWQTRPGDDGTASVRLLLPPLLEAPSTVTSASTLGGRPIYYDFDLLTRGDLPPELDARLLTDLAYTVFDTETTGLQPSEGDEIISIGAARIVNGRLLDHELFDQLVDPRRPLALSSIRVHGIEPERLQGQPTIGEVLPRFHRFAEHTVLVGHNVAFDLRFLQLKERQAGVRFDHPLLDTMLLAALVYPSQDDLSLDTLARLLGVEVVGRHRALGDARTTAGVLLKLIPLLHERGLHTLGEARRASNTTSLARLEY